MLSPLDIKELFSKMAAHTAACSSSQFLCSTRASFESWFRVELVPVLVHMGIPFQDISPDFTFPDGGKADLCIQSSSEVILFELKPFVSGQDSNKKIEYPRQINRLLKYLSENSNFLQVITFTTFYGYTEYRMRKFSEDFFSDPRWEIVGPNPLVEGYPLYLVLTSAVRPK
ncbi:MAG TPA: hypothetical protein PKM87_03720 [Methanolinea sp.]|nr:hypothetical protein [Methanolinea sp.]